MVVAAAVARIARDENLAEAHTSLALIAENYDWDWQTAGKEFRRANIILILAYVQKGQFAEALAVIEKLHRMDDSPAIWAVQSYVYGRAGQLAKARRALAKFEQLNRHGQLDPAAMHVLAYAGMGDKEKLFNCVQEAFVERSNSLVALKVDPMYDPFRKDPRFQSLLRRVGLAQ